MKRQNKEVGIASLIFTEKVFQELKKQYPTKRKLSAKDTENIISIFPLNEIDMQVKTPIDVDKMIEVLPEQYKKDWTDIVNYLRTLFCGQA